jgi:hypothetical protein
MPARFAELDWRETPMGEISLRRRHDPTVDRDVYEVKLGDEFLMSSLFTVAEVELARLALDALGTDAGLDVVVGGLGLGYTALTVLEYRSVRSLIVVDAIDAVIDWHRRGLVPAGLRLTADPRCRLVSGDFFALAGAPAGQETDQAAAQPAEQPEDTAAGLDPDEPGRLFHAVIVDIDHSPRHLLHPSHTDFYQPDGLRRLAGHLHPGGVFALWSNDPPDDEFTAALADVFDTARAEVVSFANPLQGGTSANTIYLARRA